MQITLKMQGLEKVRKQLDQISGPQFRVAASKAINDTAYEVRRKMQSEMRSAFQSPTAYILKSVYVKQADADTLVASVAPTYFGGKGVDPQQILRAQEAGGTRRDKKSEVILRRAGILPGGYQTALPKIPFPGSDDGNGNIRGPFMVQLLSYFQTFQEGQGYKANMSDKRRANLQRGTSKSMGRRYFVAYGKLRGGKTGHLAPGIWAIVGNTGADVRPVLMFVRTPRYSPRLSMARIAQVADADNYLAKRMRFRIRQAAGV